MPNVSLAPGKEPYSLPEMIKDVEKGIYIAGRGSYSIDQQRYNFQFGGQVFYEIKNGEIAACWMMWLINPTHKSFGIVV
jgi:TldD protein